MFVYRHHLSKRSIYSQISGPQIDLEIHQPVPVKDNIKCLQLLAKGITLPLALGGYNRSKDMGSKVLLYWQTHPLFRHSKSCRTELKPFGMK